MEKKSDTFICKRRSHLQQSSQPLRRAGSGNYYKLLSTDDIILPPTNITGLTAHKMAYTRRNTVPTKLTSFGCLKGNIFIKSYSLPHFLFWFGNHHYNKIMTITTSYKLPVEQCEQLPLWGIMWVLGHFPIRAFTTWGSGGWDLKCMWLLCNFPAIVLIPRAFQWCCLSLYTPHAYRRYHGSWRVLPACSFCSCPCVLGGMLVLLSNAQVLFH